VKAGWIVLAVAGFSGAAVAQQGAPVPSSLQAPVTTLSGPQTLAPPARTYDARDAGRNEDVLDRFEDELPPVSPRVGAFVIRPQLRGSLIYDDNIFATESDEEEDMIGVLGFGARALSDLPQHAIGFRANADFYQYFENTDENYWVGELGTSGRYDLNRETSFGADLSARRLVEPRDEPDDLGGEEPTVFYGYRAAVNGQNISGNIVSRVELGTQFLEYEDTETPVGTIDAESRNRDEFFGDARIGYRYLGPQEVYVRFRGNDRTFDQDLDDNGFQRESTGYRADLGATADLGGLFYLDASIGYQSQDYDDARFGTVDSPVATASLLWNPTRLTSVRAEGSYEFVESLTTGTPGYWRSLYTLRIAHELPYDFLVIGRLILQERDFERINRDDDTYGADIGLRYRIDRGLFLDAEYRFREQDSNLATAEYTRNLVLLQIRRTF